jgi:hypothetical protein
MFQQEKHEQKLRQEHELFEQQLKFQKALDAIRQNEAKASSTKLPKFSTTMGNTKTGCHFGTNSRRKLTALIFLR